MAIELPSIEIIFKQLASTLVKRSERGIAILIVADETAGKQIEIFRNERELFQEKTAYKEENYLRILDVLSFNPSKVYVVKKKVAQPIKEVLELISRTVKTGWITYVGEPADYVAITAFIKAQELEHRTYKAIVYNQTALDNRHIVNFANEKVTFKDSRATPIQAGVEYLPSLLGILASCNVERGVTNFVCKNLVEVKETIDIDKDINAGNFLLLNEFSDVRVAVGINSKTSIAEGESEDMKYIDIIETMDLIADDIRNTFKEQYQGRYKNKLDYQMLFISAVNTYFKALELNDVLDNMYGNIANVDVNAQRKAWAAIKPEAEFWDDTKVRNTSYKRNVYLAGDIKILGAMESLQFNISIF